MHAMLETIRIEAEALDAARTLIREKVVSRVAAAPGFVRGFWLEPLDGKALSILVFETEEQARDLAPPSGFSPFAGMVIERVDLASLIADARPRSGE